MRDPGLWTWYLAGLTQSLGARRDGAIVLLTPGGEPAVCVGVPGRAGGQVDRPRAGRRCRDAVAVESLEIAHEGLVRLGDPERASP